jgi:hypothetical protein
MIRQGCGSRQKEGRMKLERPNQLPGGPGTARMQILNNALVRVG